MTAATKPARKSTRTAPAAKKATAKKATAKKAVATKVTANKAVAKKAVPAQRKPAATKAVAKKAPAKVIKKAVAKKAPARKPVAKRVVVVVPPVAPVEPPAKKAPTSKPLVAKERARRKVVLPFRERLEEAMHRELKHEGPVCNPCRLNGSRLAALAAMPAVVAV